VISGTGKPTTMAVLGIQGHQGVDIDSDDWNGRAAVFEIGNQQRQVVMPMSPFR
jgi:hypothetical protein